MKALVHIFHQIMLSESLLQGLYSWRKNSFSHFMAKWYPKLINNSNCNKSKILQVILIETNFYADKKKEQSKEFIAEHFIQKNSLQI